MYPLLIQLVLEPPVYCPAPAFLNLPRGRIWKATLRTGQGCRGWSSRQVSTPVHNALSRSKFVPHPSTPTPVHHPCIERRMGDQSTYLAAKRIHKKDHPAAPAHQPSQTTQILHCQKYTTNTPDPVPANPEIPIPGNGEVSLVPTLPSQRREELRGT